MLLNMPNMLLNTPITATETANSIATTTSPALHTLRVSRIMFVPMEMPARGFLVKIDESNLKKVKT